MKWHFNKKNTTYAIYACIVILFAILCVAAVMNLEAVGGFFKKITSNIFTKTDPDTGKPVVDIILDTAGQKGTGKWTSQSALDLGAPAPTVAEAVFARCLSAIKEERVAASKILTGPKVNFTGDKKAFIESVRKALYASKICSYAQGYQLMKLAAKEYNWDLIRYFLYVLL